jgi:hypothetical protein
MKDVSSISAHITIVGCYYCNGQASSDAVPPVFEKIAATIKKQSGTCVQAVLRNSLLLNLNSEKLALTAARDSQEVQCSVNALDTRAAPRQQQASCAGANAVLLRLLDRVQVQGLQYLLTDSEDYLGGDCDIDRAEARDFRNLECNRAIAALL